MARSVLALLTRQRPAGRRRTSAGLPSCPPGPGGPCPPAGFPAPRLSARLVTAPWPPALAPQTCSRPRGGSPHPRPDPS